VLAFAGCDVGGDDDRPPQLGAKASDEEAAIKLGFPSSATRNTIRVGGGDPAADAAGVASALFPATGDSTRPTAVVLIDQGDWRAAVTAAGLAGRPIGAPILLTDGADLLPVTRDTLDRLKPKGSDLAKDAQVIRIGEETARPGGFKTAVIEGDDPYERAAAIDRFLSAAKGKSSPDVIVASGEDPAFAMPAAAWSARSGDSVLLVERDSVPRATARALREHERPSIYVLGPPRTVSRKVEAALRRFGRVRRVHGSDPVRNAIAFARYDSGRFGWGLTVPGYNFTLANASRPLDAAPAASLATRGVYAPLLLTDQAGELPRILEDYFLSVQPGFEDDPDQAVYNRVWLLGDDKTISVRQQARLDQLTELVEVQAQAP
jgi:hypothetical protein